MKIAVDFDGTIVEYAYPQIGKEVPFAIETLKLLQQEHHQIILWTVREGDLLDEAVAFCKRRGLEFFAVNASFPYENIESSGYSRKIKADLFIDDINVGGLLDWGVIYRIIHNRLSLEEVFSENEPPAKKRWLRIF